MINIVSKPKGLSELLKISGRPIGHKHFLMIDKVSYITNCKTS